MLLPGELDAAFEIARAIDGVRGWRFKSLSTALAELEGYSEESDDDCSSALKALRNAENLGVGMIFGERGG